MLGAGPPGAGLLVGGASYLALSGCFLAAALLGGWQCVGGLGPRSVNHGLSHPPPQFTRKAGP
jgi:hypothetical protein